MQYQIKYRGKRAPVRFPYIGLVVGEDPLWVTEDQYKYLISTNPRMFFTIESHGVVEVEPAQAATVEPQAELPPAEESPNYGVCEKCGQGFKVKWTYERHIARCTGAKE